jgi:hypothetical protein
MFEHHRTPLLPAAAFARRMARFAATSAVLVAGALALGVAGYHGIARLPWVDALLNAAMILSGMGPVDRMETTAAKLFATAYALFGGVAFVTTVAVLFAPLVHRFFHLLHLELEDDAESGEAVR